MHKPEQWEADSYELLNWSVENQLQLPGETNSFHEEGNLPCKPTTQPTLGPNWVRFIHNQKREIIVRVQTTQDFLQQMGDSTDIRGVIKRYGECCC